MKKKPCSAGSGQRDATLLAGGRRGLLACRRGQGLRRQRGSVLLVGLVMLAVALLLGLASMRGVLLQERMAGGFAAQNQAFQLAETALGEGEKSIRDGNLEGKPWFFAQVANAPKPLEKWADNTYAKAVVGGQLKAGARYRVSGYGQVRCAMEASRINAAGSGSTPNFGTPYRVDAYGAGPNPDIAAVLQSVYLNGC